MRRLGVPPAAASGRGGLSGLRLPAPAGLAAVGFARVSSTERRRADKLRADTLLHVRHGRSPAPLGTSPVAQCAVGRHNRADDLCAIARMLLSMRSQQSTLVSYLRSSNSLLSHRRHLIRPNVGIRFLKRFRDASRGRAVPRPRSAGTAPRRAAVSCVPCLIACALCAVPRSHAASTRRRASRGAWP